MRFNIAENSEKIVVRFKVSEAQKEGLTFDSIIDSLYDNGIVPCDVAEFIVTSEPIQNSDIRICITFNKTADIPAVISQPSEIAVYKIETARLDKITEICRGLKSHRVKIKESALYKTKDKDFILHFTSPASNLETICAVLGEFSDLDYGYKKYDGTERLFYSEHYEPIVSKDAIKKLYNL